jgi:CBS domain containing-hemolysin-like protein
MVDWSRLALVPLLIALSAFFVVAEYAVVAIRSSQIVTLRERGHRRAARALELLKGDMASAIGAIQICITLMNLLIGWLGEPAMSGLLHWLLRPLGAVIPQAVFEGAAIAISLTIVTLFTVVLSELVPKALTLQHTLLAARLVAVPMLRIRQFIRPLVWVMTGMANAVTRTLGLGRVSIADAAPTVEEIRVIAAEAGEQGTLTPRERSLILNALTLGRRTAGQIMVPRVRVAYLDVQRSMAENRRVMNEYLFSRLPLCDGGLDRVVGVVYTKEFLTAYEEQLEDSSVLLLIARPPVFVPMNVTLDRLLQEFHDRRTHLIFLVDEHGGVEGIVTVNDVVDEVIGEMSEERDNPSRTALEETGGWSVDGALPLHELAKLTGRTDLPEEPEVNTVGGLLVKQLGRVPPAGAEALHGPLRLQVLESTTTSVTRLRVTILEPKPR